MEVATARPTLTSSKAIGIIKMPETHTLSKPPIHTHNNQLHHRPRMEDGSSKEDTTTDLDMDKVRGMEATVGSNAMLCVVAGADYLQLVAMMWR